MLRFSKLCGHMRRFLKAGFLVPFLDPGIGLGIYVYISMPTWMDGWIGDGWMMNQCMDDEWMGGYMMDE